MEFQIGDRVVHPVHGVGTVKAITRDQFTGQKTRQYYEVAADSSTVWVPIGDEGVTVLRAIAPKASLTKCRRLLKSEPLPLNKDFRQRQLEISTRLKGGRMPDICEMVRDLRARSREMTLNAAEDALLRRISKALCDEWAACEGVSSAVALQEIEGLLRESLPAPSATDAV